MNNTEIKVNELLIEAINKLIEKYQKKADKERAKANQGYITYKGERYETEADIMDAYACDMFSGKVYDTLLNRLEKAKGVSSSNEMTESELIKIELDTRKNNLLIEIAQDKRAKERKEQVESRMRELMNEGYSYREAEAIIGNEELMRYE